jgi:hypothetical protein
MVALHAFQVLADYHQFYVWDAGVRPMAPTDFTDADVQRMVKVAKNVVVIQPVRNLMVDVELEVGLEDPGYDSSSYDHVAECSLELPTGRLEVHECLGGPRLNLNVSPGTYRVRALFSGLKTVSHDGTKGHDKYTVVLWPGGTMPLKVLKQWREETAG